MNKRELKKLLIYLYEHCKRDINLVFKELLENNLKVDKNTVDKWFKENKVKISDYKIGKGRKYWIVKKDELKRKVDIKS